MDNPLLLKERLNTYSQTMARQQGRMLLELSERVNRDFLKDRTVGNAFRHEMHCFVNDKLQKCQQVGEAANVAMREMKQEYQSLSEQERLLRTDAVTPYAVMRKKVSHDAVVTYVLAGVGFLSGIAQILLGVGLDWTGVGAIPGTLLLINGINNVYENGYTLLFGKNTIGPSRMMYRSAASTLGYSHSAADMALGGVDLLLSGYGLLKLSLKPEAWRLFRYINTDYIRGWRNMGRTSLMLEGGADVSTLNSIYKGSQEQ
ncbi:DUF4225 domain-containing protein [Serratia ureilytica]|uniref:DUF4225 domain-containing protein n=1 Tax=Serratia ureilytica TaxID=300181 RepID=UPI0019D29E1A|nr:DUF4225 domain-containing protein [Serratia ureilytica]MBN5208880.1 DUF4225 domain-containing protein [Serratia ureilytica]